MGNDVGKPNFGAEPGGLAGEGLVKKRPFDLVGVGGNNRAKLG